MGGSVPPTLSLTVGSASFGAFTPGVGRDYTATTTANIISTAGDAALSVSDPGHLRNGAFELPQPMRVEIAPNAWSGPVSNATSAITFRQRIDAGDALRTGTYSETLTFTLSTPTPCAVGGPGPQRRSRRSMSEQGVVSLRIDQD